ncbi:uncharacterized protein LOC123219305 [Mangifera indica]|uniref:uncharacterized protein LOC123219305 n=1 Tax=Mangifera indica TaxID=29780 RepID=UPI001CF95A3F|nr:uncharacterized protein LOC123219305 [Mangifera indica]
MIPLALDPNQNFKFISNSFIPISIFHHYTNQQLPTYTSSFQSETYSAQHTTTMKPYSIAMAYVLLLLSVILSTWLSRAQVEARPIREVSTMPSSSQALKDLQTDKKYPFKKVDSSFRRIPPSTSNPTQNKFKPPIR